MDNEEVAHNTCMDILEQNYASIETKLKNGEYAHYLEYEK
jgi:hypothetical protein